MASLLTKLESAVSNNEIPPCFTHQDFKHWIMSKNILNDRTRSPYEESYIEGFLSSSTVSSTSTKKDKALYQFKGNPTKYSFSPNGCHS
jgi:hypothetical protein